MKRNLDIFIEHEHDVIVLKKPSGSTFPFDTYTPVHGKVGWLVRRAMKAQLEELIDWLDGEDPDWSILFGNLSPLVGSAHAQAPKEEDLVTVA